MMIGTTKLYIFISIWMTLTFIQGHSCMRNKKKKPSVSIFSEISVNRIKLNMLPQPFG